MVEIALLEPEIAGNVGGAARSCAAVGASLHLIRPFGFHLADPMVRRSGMDYWEQVPTTVHAGYAAFREAEVERVDPRRVFAFSTRAGASFASIRYRPGDLLLFGPESRGLPEPVLASFPALRIPMRAPARSLNLAVAVSLALFECWRQLGYPGARD